MKQKFALEKTTFAVLMGLLAVLLLVPSCTTDDKVPDLSDEIYIRIPPDISKTHPMT